MERFLYRSHLRPCLMPTSIRGLHVQMHFKCTCISRPNRFFYSPVPLNFSLPFLFAFAFTLPLPLAYPLLSIPQWFFHLLARQWNSCLMYCCCYLVFVCGVFFVFVCFEFFCNWESYFSMHHEAVEEHFAVFGSSYSNLVEVCVIGNEECFLGAVSVYKTT